MKYSYINFNLVWGLILAILLNIGFNVCYNILESVDWSLGVFIILVGTLLLNIIVYHAIVMFVSQKRIDKNREDMIHKNRKRRLVFRDKTDSGRTRI